MTMDDLLLGMMNTNMRMQLIDNEEPFLMFEDCSIFRQWKVEIAADLGSKLVKGQIKKVLTKKAVRIAGANWGDVKKAFLVPISPEYAEKIRKEKI